MHKLLHIETNDKLQRKSKRMITTF